MTDLAENFLIVRAMEKRDFDQILSIPVNSPWYPLIARRNYVSSFKDEGHSIPSESL